MVTQLDIVACMEGFFKLITELIQITGNDVADGILLAVIGIISFMVAFGLVGIIFDAVGVHDSDIMSDCHWSIRLFVFIGLSILIISIMKVIKWLFGFQWWIYVIAFAIFITAIILVFILKHKIAKKKSFINNNNVNDSSEITKSSTKIIDRNHCPRCGGLLVKRHGPYGDFYGCNNYSTKNCKYTRKFK